MLDFLRELRGLLNYFSEMSVLGVHIDWFFHLTGVAFLVTLAAQFLKFTKPSNWLWRPSSSRKLWIFLPNPVWNTFARPDWTSFSI